MLLQQGYEFTSVASHEKLIESNKADYYLALNKTQKRWKTRQEDISPWLLFFLRIVQGQARQAAQILEEDHFEYLLSEKQLALWRWVSALPGREFSRKTAMAALDFPARTIESIIKKLLELKKIERIGEGRATRYKVV
jgi:Fic family protein